jgi:NTP pyrophosphatase (non-canonical NTP hydrolase)
LSDIPTAAREAFDMYAGLDAPDLPNAPLSALQVRLFRWEVGQFGYQPSHRYVLGIVEEIGELLESISTHDWVDALGDIQVFAIQLCTAYRLDFGTLRKVARSAGDDWREAFVFATALLARAELKSSQRIRGYTEERTREVIADGVVAVCAGVLGAARMLDLDSLDALIVTAEQVLKRDWRRAPENGEVTA